MPELDLSLSQLPCKSMVAMPVSTHKPSVHLQGNKSLFWRQIQVIMAQVPKFHCSKMEAVS